MVKILKVGQEHSREGQVYLDCLMHSHEITIRPILPVYYIIINIPQAHTQTTHTYASDGTFCQVSPCAVVYPSGLLAALVTLCFIDDDIIHCSISSIIDTTHIYEIVIFQPK